MDESQIIQTDLVRRTGEELGRDEYVILVAE